MKCNTVLKQIRVVDIVTRKNDEKPENMPERQKQI